MATTTINCCSGAEGKEPGKDPTITGPSVIEEQEAMAEGTCLRQLEVRLETMEFSMNHTQEAMRQMSEELVEWKEVMQAASEKQQETVARCQESVQRCQETVEQQGQKINNMLNMLASLPQFRLPPEFLPR